MGRVGRGRCSAGGRGRRRRRYRRRGHRRGRRRGRGCRLCLRGRHDRDCAGRLGRGSLGRSPGRRVAARVPSLAAKSNSSSDQPAGHRRHDDRHQDGGHGDQHGFQRRRSRSGRPRWISMLSGHPFRNRGGWPPQTRTGRNATRRHDRRRGPSVRDLSAGRSPRGTCRAPGRGRSHDRRSARCMRRAAARARWHRTTRRALSPSGARTSRADRAAGPGASG